MNNIKLDYKSYAIGGKKVEAYITIPKENFVDLTEDDKRKYRQELVTAIVDDIIDRRLVDIVSRPLDPISFERRISATVYLAPNEDVKLLKVLESYDR